MATFIHVVGGQGVGKSMLVLAMAAQYAARGQVCAGSDPEVFTSRCEALQQRPDADVYFIEVQNDSELDALPGELVIRMARQEAGDAARGPSEWRRIWPELFGAEGAPSIQAPANDQVGVRDAA